MPLIMVATSRVVIQNLCTPGLLHCHRRRSRGLGTLRELARFEQSLRTGPPAGQSNTSTTQAEAHPPHFNRSAIRLVSRGHEVHRTCHRCDPFEIAELRSTSIGGWWVVGSWYR